MRTPTTHLSFSEENWLAVGAEHRFHRSSDLVQRAIRAGAVENEWHQVFFGAGSFAQGVEPFLDERSVALRAHLRHAVCLLTLRLLADLEQLHRKLRLVGDKVVV